MKTIEVEPADGAKLPMESNPRRFVDRRMSVPDRAYYRRALRRGDLVKAAPVKAAVEPKAKKVAEPAEEK